MVSSRNRPRPALPPEVPSTRTPPPHHSTQGQTGNALANPFRPLLPPKSAPTFAEMCGKQQRKKFLAAYPAIYDLQEDGISKSLERMSTLASFP